MFFVLFGVNGERVILEGQCGLDGFFINLNLLKSSCTYGARLILFYLLPFSSC